MNQLDKVRVPIAAGNSHKFALSSNHLTTSNWMDFDVAYSRVMVPSSSGRLNHKTFIRTEVLDKPMLSSAKVRNRCFFVPFRTVWPTFNEFITSATSVYPSGGNDVVGILPTTPYISNREFVLFFTNSLCSTGTAGTADFYSSGTGYLLTPFGRHCMKILNQLGYKVVFDAKTDFNFSSLLILAYAKVYFDRYVPDQYRGITEWQAIEMFFQRRDNWAMDASDLFLIFSNILKVCYSDDFYSSLWDNPSAPSYGLFDTNIVIPDNSIGITRYTGKVNLNSMGTPEVQSTDNNATPPATTSQVHNFTQYLDDSLKALTEYMQRHRISSRVVDRYLMEYGTLLDVDKLNRCYYLGYDEFPLIISDVMSTSETSGASLGSYAGKAIAGTDGKDFTFDIDEFGLLLVITTIVPDTAYISGLDRNTLCTQRLDFLTNEFDSLGCDAVSQAELKVDNSVNSGVWNNSIVDTIFGFAPRYYYFKIPYDRQTGLYNYPSVSSDMTSWSLARDFDTGSINVAQFVHNPAFCMGTDAEQFNRVFLGSGREPIDPFYLVHSDHLYFTARMRPLYDNYDFDYEKANRIITENGSGSQLN